MDEQKKVYLDWKAELKTYISYLDLIKIYENNNIEVNNDLCGGDFTEGYYEAIILVDKLKGLLEKELKDVDDVLNRHFND